MLHKRPLIISGLFFLLRFLGHRSASFRQSQPMPAEQREWYEKSGLGIHYVYIGEIIHVWEK